MPITIQADDASELPEQIRGEAKNVNGKFVVEKLPDGWQPVAHVAPLLADRAKLTTVTSDAKRYQERLKQFAIDDKGTLPEPDAYREQLADYARLKELAGKQPNVEDLRKQFATDFEGRYSAKLQAEQKRASDAEKRAQDLDQALDSAVLNSAVNEFIAEMRPKEGKAEIVRMLLQRDLGIEKADGKRIVRVRGGDGQSWLTGNGADGYALPKDYAVNVIRTKHADMFQGDGVGGAGATNTNGSPRRNVLTFKRSDLNGKAQEFFTLQQRAKAEGKQVELIDD